MLPNKLNSTKSGAKSHFENLQLPSYRCEDSGCFEKVIGRLHDWAKLPHVL